MDEGSFIGYNLQSNKDQKAKKKPFCHALSFNSGKRLLLIIEEE